MNDFRADLHCHSTCSDGSDTPQEILLLAKEKGLLGLSITDHDTLAAYTPELFLLAEKLNIALLPGVECSSEWQGQVVHVLGYGYDIHSCEILHLMQEVQKRRCLRNEKIVQKLLEKKIDVAEVLQLEGSIGRPHIAMKMVQKGYVKTSGEAFERYLKEGASCYVSECKLMPLEVISLLHKAGWKAIFAHPHVIEQQKLLHALLELPWDGIECFYAHLSPEKEKAWVHLAKKKNWLVSGGSDYHGKTRPHTQLSSAWIGKEHFDALGN